MQTRNDSTDLFVGDSWSVVNHVSPPRLVAAGRLGLSNQKEFFKAGFRGITRRVRDCFLRRSESSSLVVKKAALQDLPNQSERSTQMEEEVKEHEGLLAEFGWASSLAKHEWSNHVVEGAIEESEIKADLEVAPLSFGRKSSTALEVGEAPLGSGDELITSLIAPAVEEGFYVAPLSCK